MIRFGMYHRVVRDANGNLVDQWVVTMPYLVDYILTVLFDAVKLLIAVLLWLIWRLFPHAEPVLIAYVFLYGLLLFKRRTYYLRKRNEEHGLRLSLE